MTTKNDVENFLRNFKQKSKIYQIFYRDERGKNQQTLFELDIPPNSRDTILHSLVPEDFSEGPLPDTLHHISDMWVFGKIVKNREVYIKISMGLPANRTICISFHIAEHPITYKFR